MMKEKNFNIEILRAVLIIWIVLFHYTTRFKELFDSNLFSYQFEWGGQIGVAFFFVISGFLFYSGLSRMKQLTLIEVGKFCVNKYWRLYPAYLISIILIFIFYQFVDIPGRECSLNDFLVNSIFIFHPGFHYVDSAHWFIAILIKVQIISALFLLFKPSVREKIILIFELFIICLVLLFSYFSIPFESGFNLLLSPNSFLKFLLGYNYYMVISNQEDKVKYINSVLALVIIGYYCYDINIPLVLIYSIITFIVLQNKYVPKVPTLNFTRPLIIVGKYSFVWYLVHQNIGFFILRELDIKGIISEISIVVPMIITFSIAMVIQTIINKIPRKIFSV